MMDIDPMSFSRNLAVELRANAILLLQSHESCLRRM